VARAFLPASCFSATVFPESQQADNHHLPLCNFPAPTGNYLLVAELKDQIENALNEARILILGGQVLIGVNYRAFFESAFDRLSQTSQILLILGLGVMLLGLGLLIGPAPYHRIVEHHKISENFHAFVTAVLGLGLMPFALALGADMYVAGEIVHGQNTALIAGISSAVTALACWYLLGIWKAKSNRAAHRRLSGVPMLDRNSQKSEEPKLSDKIKEVLTENRMVLPGAQALLGFQFIIMLMDGFEKVPVSSRYIHFASLTTVAICTILLIMPAAYHRIVLSGADNQQFPELAGKLLMVAMFFLALGVSGDFLVVCRKVTGSLNASLAASLGLLAVFYGFWFGWTAWKRRQTEG